MAIRVRLWWIFVVQIVLLAATLSGIIAAFSITGTQAVDRAVDESVRNNLGRLEASVLGYMSPIPRVVERMDKYRRAFGVSCADMAAGLVPEATNQRIFTDLALMADMFPSITFIYFTQLMHNGLTGDCSVQQQDGVLDVSLINESSYTTMYTCDAFPCQLSNPTDGYEQALDDEPYVLALKAVTRESEGGTWIRPTIYEDPALPSPIPLCTYTIPFEFAPDNTTVSSVAVDVSLSWFRATLLQQRNTPSTVITVVDVASGLVLSTTASDVSEINEEAGDVWDLSDIPNAAVRRVVRGAAGRMGLSLGSGEGRGSAPSTVVYEADGDVVSAQLLAEGTLLWLAVVSTPQSYYYGNSRRVMTVVTVVACIVAFAICVVSVAVWVGVVLPLKKMTTYMERVSQLEFASMSSSGKGNKPVIGELDGMHGAFKDMSRAIQSFTQYVPLEVVRSLMQSGEECDVRMVPARCTIMFADIAGFTSMCERIDTRSLAEVTRLYFDRMSIVVVAYGGTIDKFIGDCIMAIWGAPVETRDANLLGSCCALRLVQETKLDPLKREFAALGFPLKIRVGVHCGDVLAGNIGCSLRLSYTVLGDAVNTAARLESLNKQFGTSVMVSEDVAASLEDYFVLRRLSRVAVVGKLEALRVYEIVGINAGRIADLEPDTFLDVPSQGLVPCEQVFADIANPIFCPTPDQVRFCEMYTDAVALWERSSLDEARGALQEMRHSFDKGFLAPYEVGLQQLWDQCELAETSSQMSTSHSLIRNARVFVAVGK